MDIENLITYDLLAGSQPKEIAKTTDAQGIGFWFKLTAAVIRGTVKLNTTFVDELRGFEFCNDVLTTPFLGVIKKEYLPTEKLGERLIDWKNQMIDSDKKVEKAEVTDEECILVGAKAKEYISSHPETKFSYKAMYKFMLRSFANKKLAAMSQQ